MAPLALIALTTWWYVRPTLHWFDSQGSVIFLSQILLSQLGLNPWPSLWGGNLGSRPAYHPEKLRKTEKVEEKLRKLVDPGARRRKWESLPLLTPAVTGNTQHHTLLTPAVQKYDQWVPKVILQCPMVILISARDYAAVPHGYPRLTREGDRDTCVSKKRSA